MTSDTDILCASVRAITMVSMSALFSLSSPNSVTLSTGKHTGEWVYWDQLDANCLVLFYYTFFTLHISDVIYIDPQERHIMHMQSDTGKCTCELTRSTPCRVKKV